MVVLVACQSPPQSTTHITLVYPIAVGGPVQQTVEGLLAEFTRANPDIVVTPKFAGSYQDTRAAVLGHQLPVSTTVGVLLATDLEALIAARAILPVEEHVASLGADYADDVYPALLRNARAADGRLWALPFQRSTPVLYYNTTLFRAAGLDPDQPPSTWQALVAAAQRLTVPGQRWGIALPSSAFAYWILQALSLGNGQNVVGTLPNTVRFNQTATIEALQFWADLSTRAQVAPPGVVDWAQAPTDFIQGRTAMLVHTTGNLQRIVREAPFPVGVAFVPGAKAYGVPTGGGNLYLLNQGTAAEQAAAWRLMQFLVAPAQAARWSVATGYIAPRISAYAEPLLAEALTRTPQARVARDQLQYADAELATVQGPAVQAALDTAVRQVLRGEATPAGALQQAQATATQLLSSVGAQP